MFTSPSGFVRSAVLIAFAAVGCQQGADEGAAGASSEREIGVKRAALEAPIEIDTCAELQAIEEAPDESYVLIADVSCAGFDAGDGKGFRPIRGGEGFQPFHGHFDGQGHVIRNLAIERPEEWEVALFGLVQYGTVRNVGLENVAIEGLGRVGSIAASVYGSEISAVYATGVVKGEQDVGGLFGALKEGSTVADCYSSIAVQRREDWGTCGLLVGWLYDAEPTRMYSRGSLSNCDAKLIGSIESGQTITSSFFDCTLAGNCSADGGESSTTLKTSSHYSTAGWDLVDIWKLDSAGTYPCLEWQASCGTTADSDSDGTANAADGCPTDPLKTAPLGCGCHADESCLPTEIDTCAELQAINLDLFEDYVLTADVDCAGFDFGDDGGFKPIRGLSGGWEPFQGSFDGQGHIIRNLTIDRPEEDDIGLFGLVYDAEIRNVGLENVTFTGYRGVSPFSGYTYLSSYSGIYATGRVKGENDVGGLVGVIEDTSLADSFSTVSVIVHGEDAGTAHLCGLVASTVKGDGGSFTRTYGRGTASGCDASIVGELIEGGTFSDSFFDCTLAGNCSAQGGSTTTQLKTESYYEIADWDFEETWQLDAPSTYPCLAWQTDCGSTDDSDGDGALDHIDGCPTDALKVSPGACGCEQDESCLPTAIDTCAELQAMELDLGEDYVLNADIDCQGFDSGDGDGFKPIGNASGGWNPFHGTFDGQGHVIGNLTMARPGTHDQALFGVTYGASIRNVGLENVDISGNGSVAAVVGMGLYTTITQVYATGHVAGAAEVGGLVGLFNDNGALTDSYSAVIVDGVQLCGLVVGQLADGASVTRTYSSGDSSSCSGAVVGLVSSGTTVSSSFFDCTIAGNCSADGAEATATLQSESHYEAAEWDLDEIWAIEPLSYPCLRWQDGCVETEPGCDNNDATCDDVDDDCDESADEDYVATQTSCGVGACASTGQVSCVAGDEQDSCTPGTPMSSDATCNGIDDDCNGGPDEDYVGVATTCGTGACAASGTSSCVSGSVQNNCTPGTPASSDPTCNGVDEDCNGTPDEDYVGTSTSCGTGVCAATAMSSCVSGSVQNNCTPGTPASSDATCNGVDDDCSGTPDEDYASVPTSCGVGACVATGASSCVSGSVQSNCTPGTPASGDATCNDVDDDCDGTSDEDCAPEDCDNGIDDDSDGQADCLDVDCASLPACETTVPDPSTVAPAADLTHFARTYELVEFLFNGPTPVQLDVTPNTIVPARVGIVRGSVLNTAGSPLQGARISVVGHPEFGHTFSRADGQYDLAVNGGRDYRLVFERAGHPDVERSFEVEWERFAVIDDVVMTPYDTASTVVDVTSSAGMQVARGSVRTDASGSRQTTLLFPAGLTADLVMPSNVTVPLTDMTVRATEYSVGALGPQAVPAQLPPHLAYAFGAELSVDEALTAGAKSVEFSQPVISYLENFMDIPVGRSVPAGTYDHERGTWESLETGLVVEITAINSGLAELDIDGDTIADSAIVLAAWGITTDERAALANLYTPGQSLWRVSMPHFSILIVGWPGRGRGASAVSAHVPAHLHWLTLDEPTVETRGSGARIHIENGSISQDVPIAGTPFTLNYNSGRAREGVSRGLRFQVEVGLDDPEVPPNRIDVTILVEGRKLKQSVPSDTLVVEIPWDGLNAYDQQVTGAATAAIQVCYVYDPVYFVPPPSWNIDIQDMGPGEGGPWDYDDLEEMRYDISACSSYQQQLTPYLSNSLGPDGWMLSVQGMFDAEGRRQISGNGAQLSAQGRAIEHSFTDIEGPFDGETPFGDLGMRGFVPLWNGGFLMFQPDGFGPTPYYLSPTGSLTIGDITNHWHATSGQGTWTGTPAPFPGPGGSVYIHERISTRNEVRRYQLDANNRLVQEGQIVATDFNPLAVGPDGRIYGLSLPNLQRIMPDPTNEEPTPETIFVSPSIASGTNTAAIGSHAAGTLTGHASLGSRNRWLVAAGNDGTIYMVEQWFRTAAPFDGVVFGRLVALPPTGGSVDLLSHSAYEAADPDTNVNDSTGVTAIAIDPATNTPIIAVGARAKLFRVEDGELRYLAGSNFAIPSPSSKTEANTAYLIEHMHFGGDGLLYFIETRSIGIGSNKLRRLEPSFGSAPVNGGDFKLPSASGKDVLRFDPTGRHLDTRELGSNDLLYTFAYTDGLLTGIADRYNNVTSITRHGDGSLNQIVAPFGQTTTIDVDPFGRIVEIEAPGVSDYFAFAYHEDTSLLASVTNPRLYQSFFTYDDEGRLTSEEDPVGGGRTLDWSESSTEPTITTAEGVDKSYRFVRVDGSIERSLTVEGEEEQGDVETPQGETEVQKRDGTTVETLTAADPIWGMARPYTSLRNIYFPSGLTSTMTKARTVTPSSSTDRLGRASWTEVTTVNGRPYTKTFTASTRILRETSPANRATIKLLNAAGTQLQVTRPGRATQTVLFDAHGRPTQTSQTVGATTRTVLHTYDSASGYRDSTTGPIPAETSSFVTDTFGRVTSVERPDGQTTAYGLDDLGFMWSVTPPGKPMHEQSHSPVNLLSSYRAPAPGSGTPPLTVSFDYDLDRRLEHMAGADGQSATYFYQPDGKRSIIASSHDVAGYFYDAETGNLSDFVGNDATLTYEYDGSLTTSVETSGAVQGRVGFGYDNNLWLTSLRFWEVPLVTYGYDVDGLVTSATSSTPLTITRSAASGDVTSTALGVVATTHVTNAFGDSNGYTAVASSTTLFDQQITSRDTMGRVVDKTETIQGVSRAYHYGYDAANRLTDVSIDGVQSAHYDYDANGNRLARVTSAATEVGSYDVADEITSYGGLVYNYNARGTLESVVDGVTSVDYEYDTFGNLRTVNLPDGRVIEYDVDPRNRRIGKSVNGVRAYGLLYRDSLRPFVQLDAANNVSSFFVYATRRNVPDYMVSTSNGRTYRFVVDKIGSVRLVVDASDGTVAQRLDYDEFGRVLVDTSPGFQPFGFAGGLYDADTGLTRFGARDYDPVVGRWTAKDPIGFAGGDTNLYAYAGNDPVNRIDPTGLVAPVIWGLCALGACEAAASAAAWGAGLLAAGLAGGALAQFEAELTQTFNDIGLDFSNNAAEKDQLKHLGEALGKTVQELSDALHAIKKAAGIRGRSVDIAPDGTVTDPETGEWIGNIDED